MNAAGHTRRLAELRSEDSGSFGGKSSTLGELIAAEIPVPPGFAVSTSAFRAFIDGAGLGGLIAAEAARLVPDDIDSVGATSRALEPPTVELGERWHRSLERRNVGGAGFLDRRA